MFMLCALLGHSAPDVRIATAGTVAAAAKAAPVAGISFLPVLVHHLQQMATETPEAGTATLRLCPPVHDCSLQSTLMLRGGCYYAPAMP